MQFVYAAGAGAATSAFASLFRAQNGTDFAPGGLALVGEKGPELVNLPRGSQVIPNDILRAELELERRRDRLFAGDRRARRQRRSGGAAGADHRTGRATFQSRAIAAIQQARRGRVPGL